MRKAAVLFLAFLAIGTAAAQSDFIALCKTGTPEQVSTALSAGADANRRDANGMTPLMFAGAFARDPT